MRVLLSSRERETGQTRKDGCSHINYQSRQEKLLKTYPRKPEAIPAAKGAQQLIKELNTFVNERFELLT